MRIGNPFFQLFKNVQPIQSTTHLMVEESEEPWYAGGGGGGGPPPRVPPMIPTPPPVEEREPAEPVEAALIRLPPTGETE